MLIIEEADVAWSATRTWELVGDSRRLPEWFSGLSTCEVDGEVRTCTTMKGHRIQEHFATDATTMRLAYEVIDGMPMDQHASFVQVISTYSAARVLYVTWVEPASLADGMRRGMRAALDSLIDQSFGSVRSVDQGGA